MTRVQNNIDPKARGQFSYSITERATCQAARCWLSSTNTPNPNAFKATEHQTLPSKQVLLLQNPQYLLAASLEFLGRAYLERLLSSNFLLHCLFGMVNAPMSSVRLALLCRVRWGICEKRGQDSIARFSKFSSYESASVLEESSLSQSHSEIQKQRSVLLSVMSLSIASLTITLIFHTCLI